MSAETHDKSSRAPFPITGARVDDGTTIPPGTVPRWLAVIAYERLKLVSDGPVARLEDIERAGGFTPLQFVDLLAGGKGDGLAWIAISKRRISILDKEIAPQIEVVKHLTPRMIHDLRGG